MCEGGRVILHLRHNHWRPNVHVLLVGYMAEGILGRELADGAGSVQIFGENVVVRASIHRLNSFSAHAGRLELLEWLDEVAPANPQIVLTHVEETARAALREAILPGLDDAISLA
jgi:metallo-beta-lactamase family protein